MTRFPTQIYLPSHLKETSNYHLVRVGDTQEHAFVKWLQLCLYPGLSTKVQRSKYHPKFARIQHFSRYPGSQSITEASKCSTEIIHYIHFKLDLISKDILPLHLRLIVSHLNEKDRARVDKTITAQGEMAARWLYSCQKNKAERLAPSMSQEDSHWVTWLVVNLRSKVRETAAVSALSKGLNFTPTLHAVPIREFLSSTEQAAWSKPDTQAGEWDKQCDSEINQDAGKQFAPGRVLGSETT